MDGVDGEDWDGWMGVHCCIKVKIIDGSGRYTNEVTRQKGVCSV